MCEICAKSFTDILSILTTAICDRYILYIEIKKFVRNHIAMWSQDSDLNRESLESVFLTMTGIHKYISLTFWDISPYFFLLVW